MLDLEQQLLVLGRALDAEAPAVTADEARRLASQTRRRFPRLAPARRPLAVAAAVLLVMGVLGVVVRGGEDGDELMTAAPGGYLLDLEGHRDWILAFLNGDVEADDVTLAQRFSSDFLAQVPPADFRDIATTLSASAPWTVSTQVERRHDVLVTQLAGQDGTRLRLALQSDASGRLVTATVLASRDCGELIPADNTLLGADPQLQWALDLVNSDRAVMDAELAEHLSPTFVEAMSNDEFRRGLEEVRAIGPFVPRWFEGVPTADRTALLVGTATGEEARLLIEQDASGQVALLSLLTQQPCALPG